MSMVGLVIDGSEGDQRTALKDAPHPDFNYNLSTNSSKNERLLFINFNNHKFIYFEIATWQAQRTRSKAAVLGKVSRMI